MVSFTDINAEFSWVIFVDYEKMQTFLGNGVGGEAMASFLPGICTNLYRLATSGVQAGQV